jgi:hypothetical protein
LKLVFQPVEDLGGPDMEAVDNRRGHRSLLVYLFVAYAFTWLLWIPALLDALPRGWAMPSPDQYALLAAKGFADNRHLLLALAFSVAVYGPLLGALVATGYEHAAQGVRDLLAWTFNPRVAPRWYLVALIIAVALSYVPTLLAWITGNLGPPLLDAGTRLLLFVPILLLQLLTSGRCGCWDWHGRCGTTRSPRSMRCPECRQTPPPSRVRSRS